MVGRTWVKRCPAAALVAAVLCCGRIAVAGDESGALSTFIVDDVEDGLDREPGDGRCETAFGSCTLRAAMQEGLSRDATIVLASNADYQLVIEGEADAEGRTTLPPVSREIIILGNGSRIRPLGESADGRLFRVEREGSLTLQDLTLTGAHHDFQGGAILNHGSLSLVGVTLRGNTAGVNGHVAGPAGGGIFSDGEAVILDSALEQNFADSFGIADGGGIANVGSMTLFRSSVTKNATKGGNFAGMAGGIYNSGTLVIDDCTIAENHTGGSCRGGAAGGVFNDGFLLVTNSRIVDNYTRLISTASGGKGGGVVNGGQLILHRARVEGNRTGSASEDSDGGWGGGVYNSGSFVAIDSEISGNTTGDGGDTGNGGRGGGLFNSNEALLVRTTVAENHTGAGGDIGDARDGGHGGGIFNGGRLEVRNSTISLNTTGRGGCCVFGCDKVGSGGHGGGIHNEGSLAVSSSTVAANVTGPSVEAPGTPLCADFVSAGHGGGVHNDDSVDEAVITIDQTIIAGNDGVGNDCAGVITSLGYNLIEDAEGCTVAGEGTGEVLNEAALLGPLRDNGGPTRTHALLPASPAIDSGGFECPPPEIDQRGQPRTPPCDIGSFESGLGGCAGDCNEDGIVSVDEVVKGTTVALGVADVGACPSMDRDGNLSVSIDELVAATGSALHGCAAEIIAAVGRAVD